MTGAGPAAQVVSPDVCFYSGTVVIEGIELLDVESNSTLTPIKGAPAPQRLDDRKPHTEPYAERQRETDAVIGRSNLEWRVLGIRPRAIDSRGVDRRIDEFRIGWLDNNALAFGRYPLLRIGPERPRRRSLVAKTLPSCSVQSSSSSIIRRIRGKGISDLMLGSHASASIAAASWSPWKFA